MSLTHLIDPSMSQQPDRLLVQQLPVVTSTIAGDQLPSVKNERWTTLDFARGLACAFVFLVHFVSQTSTRVLGPPAWETFEAIVLNLTGFGTNLLLLLSGVLVANSISQPGFQYGRFLDRRVLRIYLPYLMIFAVEWLFFLYLPHLSYWSPSQDPKSTLLQQLFMVQGFAPLRSLVEVSWTLSFILAGYFCLPLLARLSKWVSPSPYARLYGWIFCFAVFFCTRAFLQVDVLRACYLPAGCILMELWLLRHPLLRIPFHLRTMLCFFLTALVLRVGIRADWFPILLHPHQLKTFFQFLSSLTALSLVVVIAFRFEPLLRQYLQRTPWKWVQSFGIQGYSVYLLHFTVLKIGLASFRSAFGTLADRWEINLAILFVIFGAVVLAAALFHRWVEVPSQALATALSSNYQRIFSLSRRNGAVEDFAPPPSSASTPQTLRSRAVSQSPRSH